MLHVAVARGDEVFILDAQSLAELLDAGWAIGTVDVGVDDGFELDEGAEVLDGIEVDADIVPHQQFAALDDCVADAEGNREGGAGGLAVGDDDDAVGAGAGVGGVGAGVGYQLVAGGPCWGSMVRSFRRPVLQWK